jgi:hypothetical protein
MEKILNIIRLFFGFIAASFFFIGAICFIINLDPIYGNYMYLICSIAFLLSIIVEIIIYSKNILFKSKININI